MLGGPTRWAYLALILFVLGGRCDDGDVVEEETSEESEEPAKEVFVPSSFIVPQLSGSYHLFDYFASRDAIGKRWIKSSAKKEDGDADIARYDGEWEIGTPSEISIENDFGLIVKNKARHHAISSKLDKVYHFKENPFIVQFEVKYEEGQECGGGYVKMLSEGADLPTFRDKTPYTIMFGPDKCGTSGKVHVIFRYKNPINGSVDEYHAKQPSNVGSSYWDDHNTHLYSLVVKPDGSFTVSVDQKVLFGGNMLTDLVPELVPPKIIADPSDKKPEEWDDRAEIEDDTAVKPEDWDEAQPKEIIDEAAVKPADWNEEEPELIPDPDSVKPADWDTDMDGDWEPPSIDNPVCKGFSGCGVWKRPTIPNPQYKGKWIRPKIANPAYKGVWAPRQIDNPHYFEPTPFGGLAPISAIGIEMWTMSQNIIFDNILVTDSEEVAADAAKQTFVIRRSEEARLASSKGQGGGVIQAIIDAANERPWLWAVYILCVLIPVILIGVCCFGRKSGPVDSSSAGYRKKTDVFQDDDIPNLVGEEAEEEIEGDEEPQPTAKPAAKAAPAKTASPKVSPKKEAKPVPQAMRDMEDDSASDESGSEFDDDVRESDQGHEEEEEEAPEEEQEPEPEPEPEVPKQKSPVVTKRKARRQD